MSKFVKEKVPEHWALGKKSGGFLATNMGVRSLLEVLKNVLFYIQDRDSVSLDLLDGQEFMPDTCAILEPVIQYFVTTSPDVVRRFRDQVGMAGVTRNQFEMMRIIKLANPEFNAKGLEEFIASLDEEGTREAQVLIDEVNERLYKHMIAVLKKEYGDKWWKQCVPERIRTKVAELQEKDSEDSEKWHHLFLINYRDIALKNWNLFQKSISLFHKGNKKKETQWLVELNKFRHTTHHKERGLLKADEVNRVWEIHKVFTEQLEKVEDADPDLVA